MRGLDKAKEFHESNSGLPYNNFKLEKHGQQAIVRVLQPDSEFVNFFVHQVYDNNSKRFSLAPTRCPSESKDRDEAARVCPLCDLSKDDVPRSLKTFIPVRVREMDPADRVDIITYGRNGLDAVINIISELPQGQDITMCDIKIKRQGTGLDTIYYWMLQPNTVRPLSEQEASLVVPDMDALWQPPSEIELDRRARQLSQSNGVTNVRLIEDSSEQEALPF